MIMKKYQSAVPTLPIKIPGASVIPVDKDQFRVADETSILGVTQRIDEEASTRKGLIAAIGPRRGYRPLTTDIIAAAKQQSQYPAVPHPLSCGPSHEAPGYLPV